MKPYIITGLPNFLLSLADFLVKISPRPARVKVYPVNAPGSGVNMLDLLAKYDPATQSLKTSPHLDTKKKAFTESSLTWPRSGMMRNGIVYRLPPLVRLTKGAGSGLWHTPQGDHAGRGEYQDIEKIKSRQSYI